MIIELSESQNNNEVVIDDHWVIEFLLNIINLELDIKLELLQNQISKIIIKQSMNYICVSFKAFEFASSIVNLLSKLKSNNSNNEVVMKYSNFSLSSDFKEFFKKIFGDLNNSDEESCSIQESYKEIHEDDVDVDNIELTNAIANSNNNQIKEEINSLEVFSNDLLNINEMWQEIEENDKIVFYNPILDQTLSELPLGASLSKYNNSKETLNLQTQLVNDTITNSTSIVSLNNITKDKEEEEHLEWFENNNREKILWNQLQYKKLTSWMKRPARKQVEDLKTETAYTEGHYDYNIWYDKYLTDRSDDKVKVASLYKCNPALDTGYTRADYQGNKGDLHFCMFFARGCCAQGANCRYYHRVPTFEDCEKTDNMKDIFGRTRFSAHRQDMGGVGTFTRECKTLYITNIKGNGDKKDTVKLLYQAFSPWGKIEDINYFDIKASCFMRFSHRCMAEFAKEAMIGQTLIGDDVIVIKWAIEEDDKVRKKRKEIEDKKKFVSAFEKNEKYGGMKNTGGSNKYSLGSSIQNYKKNYGDDKVDNKHFGKFRK